MSALKPVLDMISSLRTASQLTTRRGFGDVLADRIVQACAEPDLLAMVERLAKSLDVSVDFVSRAKLAAFLAVASGPDAGAVLVWLRKHPRVAAMIAGLRDEGDYIDAIDGIVLPPAPPVQDLAAVAPAPSYDVGIRAQLLAPLSHGADGKAGNATLFRRRQVITPGGPILDLPFYGGNALRGQMRDLLADHLLTALGLTPRRDIPPLNLWFFHALYAGGVLEEGGRAGKLGDDLGKSGALRTDGLRRLRDTLPGLSLLGTAIGNRVLHGRICVSDLRPCCREWGGGPIPAAELMEWSYLTRRDDYEGRAEEDQHRGMIATTECLKAGAWLDGGIDIDTHASEPERAALGQGLVLLAERGFLGAQNRMGLGRCALSFEGAPDPGSYLAYLETSREAILSYLSEIDALAPSGPVGPSDIVPAGLPDDPLSPATGPVRGDGRGGAKRSARGTARA